MNIRFHHHTLLLIILSGFILYPLGEVRGQTPEPNTAEGYYMRGMKYQLGRGVQQDSTEAIKWLRKAAAEGHVKSQYNLGVIHAKGAGVEKNERDAANWFYLAAEQDHPKAQYYLGLFYGKGHGVPQSNSQAAKWMIKAAKQLDSQDAYRKTAIWCRRAADDGEMFAIETLGDYFSQGNGVKKDVVEASTWYRKAAEQFDGKKNYKEAARFYHKAADLGDANSLYKLGLYYNEGLGVSQSSEEAEIMFNAAAEAGGAELKFDVGMRYVEGMGVPLDIDKALFWLNSANDFGHPEAQENIYKLIGEPPDEAEPAVEPVDETVDEPVDESVEVHVDEFVEEPVVKPVTQFVEEPVVEPVTQFVEEPVVEPVSQFVEEPVVEPVTQFVEEPIIEPVAETVSQIVNEPVVETLEQNTPTIPTDEEFKSLSVIERDQIPYLSKEIKVKGVIQLDRYYDFGYYDAEYTHISFKFIDDRYSYAYLYGNIDWAGAKDLKDKIIDTGSQTGTFNFIIYRSRYAESSAILAELIDYTLDSE